ncbi:MAG TPA: methyltransferase domain-containing protein [Brevundimonas sp.]|jgi:SAM-dependent methyltransferase|uniref:class I SAM-dependent methyltransferase n=1 Tax=Brevundimonas sp. TaxID=1871086 RepID=UPI002E165A80|nr:methyltransferase domain-containing protein [Brevundimonas sp.]
MVFHALFNRRPAPEQTPRDTDADWEEIGRTHPYFGVLTDPRFRSENLTEESLADFFRSGEHQINHEAGLLRGRYPDFAPRSALDFGCGVGRLTRPLALMTGDAFGVDIAESMLAEARRQECEGATFGRDLPDRHFDWIVSLIVFQHIPPERGYPLLKALMARLAVGGFITLQFALYRDLRHASVPGGRIVMGEDLTTVSNIEALRDLAKGEMVMFDYDLTVICAILFNAGITDLELSHTDHGGFHGASIRGRRTA